MLDKVSNINGILMIAAVLILVILIASFKSRSDILINFILRAVLGTAAVYFLNTVCSGQGLGWHVGIGPLSVLTSGILGFPGVILLYGIKICSLL